MSQAQRDWQLLRIKDDTADDPNWVNLQVNPNSFTITVGGTASDGSYTITIVPVEVDNASVANTFVRGAGESNATIADELEQLLTADLATGGTLFDYLESATDDGAGVITVVVKQDAPPFTVTTSAPGTGTLTLAPDDTFPITRELSFHRASLSAMTSVEFAFIPISSGGVPLENDNAMTFTLEILDLVDRARKQIGGVAFTSASYAVGVTSSTATTSHSVNDKFIVPINGSKGLGIRLSAITGTPTSYDALEVWVREAVS